MRTCSDCGLTKPIDAFTPIRGTLYHHRRCKACRADRAREAKPLRAVAPKPIKPQERSQTEGAAWRADVHRVWRNEVDRRVSPDQVDQDRLLRKVPRLPCQAGKGAVLG